MKRKISRNQKGIDFVLYIRKNGAEPKTIVDSFVGPFTVYFFGGGKRTVKVVPFPWVLSKVTVPPKPSVMRLTTAKPKP